MTNYLRAILVLFLFGLLTACGGIPPVCKEMPIVDCKTAQAYQACTVKNEVNKPARIGARDVVKSMCGDDEDGAKKGAPYQQVCPAGAACNQGVN